MLGSQIEVRPGRWLYVEFFYGDPRGPLADSRQAALMVHGSMAHCSQVPCSEDDSSTVTTTCSPSLTRGMAFLQYDEQCKALLRSGIGVCRYDLLGCGASARPRPACRSSRLSVYGPTEAYKDLEAIQQLCIEGKVRASGSH